MDGATMTTPCRRPMRVRGGHHIGPGGVDLRVDGKRRRIEGPVTFDHVATIVHQDEVLDPDELEVQPERVDPEMVG